MAENKKVFFIINKYSGTGYRPEVEGRIIDRCAALGYECTIEFTQSRGHATGLAQQAVKENFKIVFAMGGDGTVNEVAQGLVHTDTALGILPKGSGNGLARHLKIPLKFKDALELLPRHQVLKMDTFLVNNQLSVNVSGIGFDGHIANLFGKNGKRGLMTYGKLVMSEFNSYNEFKMHITIDGKQLERDSFILAFANSSQFGNNARIAPFASVCDELIDVCFIKKVPLSQVVGFATKMFTGKMENSAFVEIIKAKKINVDFASPVAYHIDGEGHTASKSFEIQMQPCSLNILVPVSQSVF